MLINNLKSIKFIKNKAFINYTLIGNKFNIYHRKLNYTGGFI